MERSKGGIKSTNYEKLSKLYISNQKNDATIEISDTSCKLVKSNSKCLSDLLEVEMSAGKMLYMLQRRGFNLIPTSNDINRIPKFPQPTKDSSLELKGTT